MPNVEWGEINDLMHDIKGTLTVLVATRHAVMKDLDKIQKKLIKQMKDLEKIILKQAD